MADIRSVVITKEVTLMLLATVLTSTIVQVTLAVTCHYCFNADLIGDCFITKIDCPNDYYVCYTEKNIITHEYGMNSRPTDLTLYKMGCEHHSLCRDRTTHGPSPYGYAVITMGCCCGDMCDKADGVGRGNYDHCPRLWKNYTHGTESNLGNKLHICSVEVFLLNVIIVFAYHSALFF